MNTIVAHLFLPLFLFRFRFPRGPSIAPPPLLLPGGEWRGTGGGTHLCSVGEGVSHREEDF